MGGIDDEIRDGDLLRLHAETELFAQTYKSYGLATVRYPVLEIEARVEPFENGRGFSLRVMRAGKPRSTRSGA